MRAKSLLAKLWNLPMQVALNPDFIGEVYVIFLTAVIHGSLALWVYNDSRLQERSGFWALGTFFFPQAFFPLYFWNQMPELIWTCPKCQRDNRAWSRKCGHCNQFYTAEETVARLHGYFNPSDPVVIFLITLLFQGGAHYVAILMAEGIEVLTTTNAIYTLPASHFWSVKLVVGNVLIWVSLFCITGRYRRTIKSIGLAYSGNLADFGPPLLLAPALAFVSISFMQGISWFSQEIPLEGLGNLAQWEQQQWASSMPENLGDGTLILLGFVMLILMPVGEEILFRGIGYIGFAGRFGQTKGMVLSALLFAALHGYIRSFVPLVLGGIPIFLMGLTLAWLYIRTKSLIPCIVTHSLVNLILILIYWM